MRKRRRELQKDETQKILGMELDCETEEETHGARNPLRSEYDNHDRLYRGRCNRLGHYGRTYRRCSSLAI